MPKKKMILTNELLEAAKSDNGGWNTHQLRALGFTGFVHGWRRAVTGTDVPDEVYAKVLSLRNIHLVRKEAPFETYPDAWSIERRSELLAKKNEAETYIEKVLMSTSFAFTRELPVEIDGKKWFIDFHIRRLLQGNNRPPIMVALEIDGGYHFTKEQHEMDKRKDAQLMSTKLVRGVVRIAAHMAVGLDKYTLSGMIVNTNPAGTAYHYC